MSQDNNGGAFLSTLCIDWLNVISLISNRVRSSALLKSFEKNTSDGKLSHLHYYKTSTIYLSSSVRESCHLISRWIFIKPSDFKWMARMVQLEIIKGIYSLCDKFKDLRRFYAFMPFPYAVLDETFQFTYLCMCTCIAALSSWLFCCCCCLIIVGMCEWLSQNI